MRCFDCLDAVVAFPKACDRCQGALHPECVLFSSTDALELCEACFEIRNSTGGAPQYDTCCPKAYLAFKSSHTVCPEHGTRAYDAARKIYLGEERDKWERVGRKKKDTPT